MKKTITVEATSTIDAPAGAIFAVLADYHVGHPAILPKAFTGITVKKGGQGAGSELDVETTVFGQRRAYDLFVSEHREGDNLNLVETDRNTGLSTTFRIQPLNPGEASQVTISSQLAIGGGVAGLLEEFMMRTFAKRLFKQELNNLSDYIHHN